MTTGINGNPFTRENPTQDAVRRRTCVILATTFAMGIAAVMVVGFAIGRASVAGGVWSECRVFEDTGELADWIVEHPGVSIEGCVVLRSVPSDTVPAEQVGAP